MQKIFWVEQRKEIDLAEGTTVQHLKAKLEDEYAELKRLKSYFIAVDDEYAENDQVITCTNEIAIIPPYKRWIDTMIDIKITENKLDITECLDLAKDLGSGGIATFIGTVRNRTKNKPVVRLEYECYQSMAIKEVRK